MLLCGYTVPIRNCYTTRQQGVLLRLDNASWPASDDAGQIRHASTDTLVLVGHVLCKRGLIGPLQHGHCIPFSLHASNDPYPAATRIQGRTHMHTRATCSPMRLPSCYLQACSRCRHLLLKVCNARARLPNGNITGHSAILQTDTAGCVYL